MVRGRAARLVAAAFAVVLLGAACTDDNPEQPLPCEFYEGQVDTGAIDIDEVPEEIRDAVRDGCPQ